MLHLANCETGPGNIGLVVGSLYKLNALILQRFMSDYIYQLYTIIHDTVSLILFQFNFQGIISLQDGLLCMYPIFAAFEPEATCQNSIPSTQSFVASNISENDVGAISCFDTCNRSGLFKN